MKNISNNFFTCLGWLILAILYSLLSFKTDNPLLLPTLFSIGKNIYKNIFSLEGFIIICNTLKTLFFSTISSIGIAIFFAIITKIIPMLSFLIQPIFSLLKSIPTIGLILIALIYLKLDLAPLFIGIVISVGIFYDLILSGINSVDSSLLEMAKLYKVKNIYIIKEIYIPSIFWKLNTSLHSILSLILKVIIAGEVLANLNKTIGGELIIQKNYFNTDIFFSWLLIVAILSIIFETLIKYFSLKYRRWDKNASN